MAHTDYSHRDVLDKLSLKPGQAIEIVECAGPIDRELRERVLERVARPHAGDDEQADILLVTANDCTRIIELLAHCRTRINPAGGIWMLTPKRGQPGYLDQRLLIDAGPSAGLVDNKVCSVSDAVSAIRFVIRKADRPAMR